MIQQAWRLMMLVLALPVIAACQTSSDTTDHSMGAVIGAGVGAVIGAGTASIRIETGRAPLYPDRGEEPGYALYSYLLFYGPPTADNEERYLAALGAYGEEIPDVREFRAHVLKRELNVTYLPLKGGTPWDLEGADAGKRLPRLWLEGYDFVRAKLLLRVVPKVQKDGPYFISYDKPLSQIERGLGRDELLFQDLSWVPPDLVRVWVRAFLRQAGQPGEFNRGNPWQQFILKLRTGIEVAATGLPEVEKAWADAKEQWEKAVAPVKPSRQP